jgi:CRP-like cAMP-binding protein
LFALRSLPDPQQQSLMTQPLCHHLRTTLGVLPPELEAQASNVHGQSLDHGEALLRAGEVWSHLLWIERGSFRLFYLDRQGRAANKNFYLEGAMLWPITPALAQSPSQFWVEALEPSQAWKLPWVAWQTAAQSFEPWQRLERQVLTRLLEDKMSREQAFLQCTATERYQALLSAHPDWARRIPLCHLASYLGITDVALSRIRRRLNPGEGAAP